MTIFHYELSTVDKHINILVDNKQELPPFWWKKKNLYYRPVFNDYLWIVLRPGENSIIEK